MPGELFDILDLNGDGELSRSELHRAAKRLGWQWHEAPILALFDLLTILKPIPKDNFLACIRQIKEDSMGPYGKVLLNSPHFSPVAAPAGELRLSRVWEGICSKTKKQNSAIPDEAKTGNGGLLSEHTAGADISNNYGRILSTLDIVQISDHDAALLIIDPQRSFTTGVWMQSIGPQAEVDQAAIPVQAGDAALSHAQP